MSSHFYFLTIENFHPMGWLCSRFTMAELVNALGNQNVKAFTVGAKRDTRGMVCQQNMQKIQNSP
jgi:hypothetical protein